MAWFRLTLADVRCFDLDSMGNGLRAAVWMQPPTSLAFPPLGMAAPILRSARCGGKLRCGRLARDYFGALFPLNPGGIIPAGPNLSTLVKTAIPLP